MLLNFYRMSTLILLWVFSLNSFSLHSNAQDLIVAPAESPFYDLSNIRIDRDRFGRSVLAVDYKLTKNTARGNTLVEVAGKSKDGQLQVFGVGIRDASGTLRIQIDVMMMGERDFEIYFVTGGGFDKQYLVSNIVRTGNPGPATTARNLTAEEKAAIEEAIKFNTPPEHVPAGYLAVDQSTKLVPGMPVKAGYRGEWKEAEVISFDVGGPVRFKFPSEDTIHSRPREKWLAVDPEIADKAKSNPEQFKPSVSTLAKGSQIIPHGALALEDDIELPPGTPVLLDSRVRWEKGFVVKTEGGSVTFRREGRPANFDKNEPRSSFIIAEKTLDDLKDPASAKKWIANLADPHSRRTDADTSFPSSTASKSEEIRQEIEDHRKEMLRQRYAIDIAIPKGAQIVPDDLVVEKGTSLAGCWGRKWRHITALAENEDGSIKVHWNDYGTAFDGDMSRDQLIIEDKTLKKMKRRSKSETDAAAGHDTESTSADDLKKTLRTWSDASGKFKIEAYYVNKSADQVTIKTDAGREITLPIEKLSEKDQALLGGLEAAVENPFK